VKAKEKNNFGIQFERDKVEWSG